MDTIERINNELVKLAIPRQLIPPDPVNYIPWTALTVFLSSLASERCVWTYNRKTGMYQSGCNAYRQEVITTDYCPDCGKRIEVKEADNDRD